MKTHFHRLIAVPVVVFLAAAIAPVARAIPIQPDLLVSGKPGSGFKGADLHNTTGAGQSLNRRTRGKPVKAFVRVENDGATDTNITITGSPGNRKFRTRYFADGMNRTATITRGTFAPHIEGNWQGAESGTTIHLVQKTKPTGKLRGKRARKTFSVMGREGSDVDRVRVTVRKTR